MLLLLHFKDGAVFERPSNNVRLLANILDDCRGF